MTTPDIHQVWTVRGRDVDQPAAQVLLLSRIGDGWLGLPLLFDEGLACDQDVRLPQFVIPQTGDAWVMARESLAVPTEALAVPRAILPTPVVEMILAPHRHAAGSPAAPPLLDEAADPRPAGRQAFITRLREDLNTCQPTRSAPLPAAAALALAAQLRDTAALLESRTWNTADHRPPSPMNFPEGLLMTASSTPLPATRVTPIDHVLAEAQQLLGADYPDAVNRLHEAKGAALADPRLRVVVLGEFNSGKSSLINALTGADLVPVGATECTSYVTTVASAETPAIRKVILRDGQEVREAISSAQLMQLTAASEADPDIVRLEVDAPQLGVAGWAGRNVVVVDTPGLQSLSTLRASITVNFLPKADVLVLAISALTGLNRTQKEFIGEHLSSRQKGRLLVAITQTDRLSDEDVHLVKAKTIEDLAGLIDAPAVIVTAAPPRAKGEALVADLQHRIQATAAASRDSYLQERFEREARPVLDLVSTRLQAELTALRQVPEQVEKAIQTKLNEQSVELRELDARRKERLKIADRALADVRGTVPGAVAQIMTVVERRVQGCTTVEQLEGYLKQELGAEAARELKALSERLETDLRAAVREICAAPASTLSRQGVAPIGASIEAQIPVDTIITVLNALLLLLPGGVLIKGLLTILSRTIVPEIVGRYVLNQAKQQVLAQLNDQRAAMETSLQNAIGQARDDILAAIEKAIHDQGQAIIAGYEKALDAQRAGVEQANARVAHVSSLLPKLDALLPGRQRVIC